MVKLLLRYGGNPQQSNRKGETPLKVASSPTMVNLLLGKGTYTSSEESSTGEWSMNLGLILPCVSVSAPGWQRPPAHPLHAA